MIRWRDLFHEALQHDLAVGVARTAAAHLGRQPTTSELSAARRAAHRYAAAGNAQLIHVSIEGGQRGMLVLARPGRRIPETVAHEAATRRPTPGRRRRPDASTLLERIQRAVETAATDSRQLDTARLSAAAAGEAAQVLAEPLAELSRLRHRLRKRAERRTRPRPPRPVGKEDPAKQAAPRR